jgi:hypothetical protein
LLFTICCIGATAILSKLAEGASMGELILLFVLAIGSGYAYGTFQMYYLYEALIDNAIKEIKKDSDGK